MTRLQFACGALICASAQVLAASIPDSSSIGAVQVLNYNNLGPENNGTAALLIYDLLSNADALTRCESMGESLLPAATIQGVSGGPTTEMQFQLNYLVASDSLQNEDLLWVGGSSNGDCVAYSHSSMNVSVVPCSNTLPAFCTSSAAPTTDLDNTIAPTAELKVTISANGFNITGYRDKRSFRFLGVPYAAPPVKELRFMPPSPYAGSKSIEATVMGASCFQPPGPFSDTTNMSEDCLTLNIFTPVLPALVAPASARRPVAVYFYGGAFEEGAISLIEYDGGNSASRNDIVIVTVNYRIGALGHVATESILDGSLSIKDQIAALRWVNENIAPYGGDPTQITIFGQSAGAQSVSAILSSSAAQGLFHGAIAQSSPFDLPWYTRDVYTKIVTPIISVAMGCNYTNTEQELVSCLQSIPAADFVSTNATYNNALTSIVTSVSNDYFHTSFLVADTEPVMPMVDDKDTGVIDGQFYQLLSNGNLPSRVPVMFTNVKDEAALYIDLAFTSNLGNSQAVLNQDLNVVYTPDLVQQFIASGDVTTNPDDPDSVRNVLGAVGTVTEWTCAQAFLLDNGGVSSFPSLYEIEIAQGHQSSTIDIPPICLPNSDFNATCHASDVMLVWGTLNSKTKNVLPYYSNDDILHSQLLNDVWGSFIRSANPNPDIEILKIRGPAYASTLNIFANDNYVIDPYKAHAATLPLLSIPPSTIANPGQSGQCAVFQEHGFTFQIANLTI
jgi:carboxylesterase type B